jgi:four helix bundle protein
VPIRNYKDLVVWQKSVDLAVTIYAATTNFPAEERFGLTDQLRRAAVSISSNIAEGNGRSTTKDYLRFLATSNGSLNEVGSLLAVSTRLHFLTDKNLSGLEARCDEIGKMLSSLRATLRKRMRRVPKP